MYFPESHCQPTHCSPGGGGGQAGSRNLLFPADWTQSFGLAVHQPTRASSGWAGSHLDLGLGSRAQPPECPISAPTLQASFLPSAKPAHNMSSLMVFG